MNIPHRRPSIAPHFVDFACSFALTGVDEALDIAAAGPAAPVRRRLGSAPAGLTGGRRQRRPPVSATALHANTRPTSSGPGRRTGEP